MKKIILFTGVLFLAACGGNEKPAADAKAEAEELKTTLLPNIEGVWVMKDYISKMESSRSPEVASDVLEGIVGIDINKASLRTDSLEGGANWNNHEGNGFTIYLKKGIAENSVKTALGDDKGFFEIGYADSSLVLYHYDKSSNKLIGKRMFKKVLRKQLNSDLSFGIQYIVSKKLFAGNYSCTDSASKKSDVEFTVDGKVKGFADYKYYLPATDFMDAFSNMDYITVVKDENNSDAYGYTSRNDSICFYTIVKNEKEGTISYGKLRYTFLKKRN